METMNDGEKWHRPRPERLPRPTYCPVMIAVAIVLMAWGPLASWILLGAGAALFLLAVACWVNEVRDDAPAS